MNGTENKSFSREAARADEYFRRLRANANENVILTPCMRKLTEWPTCRHHTHCANGLICNATALEGRIDKKKEWMSGAKARIRYYEQTIRRRTEVKDGNRRKNESLDQVQTE